MPGIMSFERYRLRMSPRWMTLEPADSTLQVRQVLFIDRTSCEVSLRERLEVAALSKATSDEIVYGLVGIANSYIDRYAGCCLARVAAVSPAPLRSRASFSVGFLSQFTTPRRWALMGTWLTRALLLCFALCCLPRAPLFVRFPRASR